LETPVVAMMAGRKRTSARRYRYQPYLFISPFFVVFAAFGLYPLLFALRLSFTDWHGTGVPHYIGFANYTYLLTSPDWWHALWVSALLWILIVPAEIALALVLAVLLSRARLRGRALFRTAFIAPLVTPLVAMAQVWIILFDNHFGAVNRLLSALHLPQPAWLDSTTWSRPTLALLVLWKTLGFAVIIMLAGLQSINTDLYEAGDLDGTSWGQRLWYITLPLMRRSIAFYLVIDTLAVFQMFAEPYVVTKGGPDNSTTNAGMYLYGFIDNIDLGTGAAASFLLVLIMLAVSLMSVRLLRSREEVR
jgi:ABC-type sugar transport system permease subunit